MKLDENLPEDCVSVLAEFGHSAATVREEGLAGGGDSHVLRAACAEGRMLLTLDRGFGDLRAYPPGTHEGIIVLRLDDQRTELITATLRILLAGLQLDDLRGCNGVLQRGVMRINWPDTRTT